MIPYLFRKMPVCSGFLSYVFLYPLQELLGENQLLFVSYFHSKPINEHGAHFAGMILIAWWVVKFMCIEGDFIANSSEDMALENQGCMRAGSSVKQS